MLDPRDLLRALGAAFVKPQGSLGAVAPSTVEALPAVHTEAMIRPAALRRYRAVCGLEGDAVPICYPETLFLGPMTRLVSRPAFPLSPLGLIHTRQTVRTVARVPIRRPLDLTARIAEVRPTDRGVEVRIAMEVAAGPEVCWQGVATLLSRSAATRRGRGRARAANESLDVLSAPAERLDVSGRTGIDYAIASGDFNPHHLTWWTARPLGYRRPIAHGMWTLARALGLLRRRAPLPARVSVEAAFKRPLFMPATVAFSAIEAGDATQLAVFAPETRVPHLLATVRPD